MAPELHKQLKLRSVQEDMKMSELAELLLERYLLERTSGHVQICPHCHEELTSRERPQVVSKLPVGSA